ncbi:RusA family crossover junction endodeoxyribonuclease [Chitinophaga sp. Mgbs1]|uniref:RusA family crossover junction endodeoxyribonuclease n=1 Tax=Chitinophaga solisilvae TaxID=1233460 RepID=A0A3S1BNZ5_9BACT|nr:RusA family crossover junction endodeoxyribonuclease [Chitinophaga solisilvae]
MNINIKTGNCDYKIPAVFPESLDSEITIEIRFPEHIPTDQSRKEVKESIINLIKSALQQFEWLCFGPLWIELTWFLQADDRQESDATGDLDNITKPVLDALSGLDGIMVDDTQIKSIYTRWLAKNSALPEQFLSINIRMLNDETISKDKVHFIQYHGPMCFVIDLNPAVPEELRGIKLFADAKRHQRQTASQMRKTGMDVGLVLIASQKDFHRTRLRNIPADRIYKLA